MDLDTSHLVGINGQIFKNQAPNISNTTILKKGYITITNGHYWILYHSKKSKLGICWGLFPKIFCVKTIHSSRDTNLQQLILSVSLVETVCLVVFSVSIHRGSQKRTAEIYQTKMLAPQTEISSHLPYSLS